MDDVIEVALILFYSLSYLRFGVLELDFRHSGVVNGLVRGVSVSRHFLNEIKNLYITNVMYTNTWKS